MATLVKLGGSVLTERGRPHCFREDVAQRLAAEIAHELRQGLETPIIVFGTGRAGKAYAKHYGGPRMSTMDWQVYQLTTHAIGRLGMGLSGVLGEAGVPHALLPANALFRRTPNGVVWQNSESVLRLRANGVVPVIGGDVLVDGLRNFSIISSDTITGLAALLTPVSECVFVTNVDGVLDENARLVPLIDELTELSASPSDQADITGGMSAKVAEALRIARLNKQVLIVNGLVPGRMGAAMRGGKVTGTVVVSDTEFFPLPELRRGPRCLHSDIA
jgi:isopentenyl phosphate kinase